MQIKNFDDSISEQWDTFVEACPEATFFHKAGWKTVIERSFKHKTYFLYAEDDGKIVGILPLAQIKSLLFGNALTSLPFCVYGGVATSNEEAREALDKAACDLARELGVDHLEMRNIERRKPERPFKELYVTFRKEIDSDPEVNLKAIPRKQRAVVRKGIKAGLKGIEEQTVDRMYEAYAESVRNLGTPVFSKKYFAILKEVFGKQCEILVIEHEGQTIAGVMSFYFKDQVLPYYGGGTSAARNLYGNDFMYWEVMCRAAKRGVKIFDYGRSKRDTGSYRFKKHWGFEPEPIHYEFELVKAKEMPDLNPLNPKYKLFIESWQKLPLPISKFVGPFLSKDLG